MAAKLTGLAHKIAIKLHLVAERLYHLEYSQQAANPETFGYTLVYSSGGKQKRKFDCKLNGTVGNNGRNETGELVLLRLPTATHRRDETSR
jgi:hypothetical protein